MDRRFISSQKYGTYDSQAFEVSDITVQVQGPAKEMNPWRKYFQMLISMKAISGLI